MRIEQDLRFEAAHFLPRVPAGHRCARMHGHTYVVTVAVDGPLHPELGWVLDYADLDAAVAPLIAQLDHCLLNELPGLDNPTSEVIAMWLWDRLAPALPGLAEIRVAETFDTRCVYKGPSSP